MENTNYERFWEKKSHFATRIEKKIKENFIMIRNDITFDKNYCNNGYIIGNWLRS